MDDNWHGIVRGVRLRAAISNLFRLTTAVTAYAISLPKTVRCLTELTELVVLVDSFALVLK